MLQTDVGGGRLTLTNSCGSMSPLRKEVGSSPRLACGLYSEAWCEGRCAEGSTGSRARRFVRKASRPRVLTPSHVPPPSRSRPATVPEPSDHVCSGCVGLRVLAGRQADVVVGVGIVVVMAAGRGSA